MTSTTPSSPSRAPSVVQSMTSSSTTAMSVGSPEGDCVTPATRASGSSETTQSCCERPLDTSADKPDIFAATYEPAEPHPVARVELFTDTTGDHHWRAIARNGEIVATSGEGYRNASHARTMAERILPGVEIRDEETDRG